MFPLGSINATISIVGINNLKCCSAWWHDMPRKKKVTDSSEVGCATETPAVSQHVLRSHTKQAKLQFAVMPSNKETPVTSTSTPLKADTQQLLAKILPDVLCKALRNFCECILITTLLVTNQSSQGFLSKIPTPEQGTVKLSSTLPSGVIPDGLDLRFSSWKCSKFMLFLCFLTMYNGSVRCTVRITQNSDF